MLIDKQFLNVILSSWRHYGFRDFNDLGWSKLIYSQQWSRVTVLSSIAFIALHVAPAMAVMTFDYTCTSNTPRKLKSGVSRFAHSDDSEMQAGIGSEGNKNPMFYLLRVSAGGAIDAECVRLTNQRWNIFFPIDTSFYLKLALCSATAKLMESRFFLKALSRIYPYTFERSKIDLMW